MQDEAVLALLTNMDAITEGHFELKDGKHTPLYIRMPVALQHPDIVSDFAEQLSSKYFEEKIDVVISPAVSGVVLGQEIAKKLEIRHIYMEPAGDAMFLKSGFKIFSGENVLIVDDVINTGKNIKAVMKKVKEVGGKVTGVACIVDRAVKKLKIKPEIKHLLALRLPVFAPEKCDLCREKKPLSVE
ncbi:MAG: phosphoribosyltransferase family protein [Candidatus Muiribacteriota bacterium]